MSDYSSTTFLTGATGFLGHFILRDLLNRGRRVVAMLRPPMGETARRLAVMLGRIGVDMAEAIERDRLVLVEGSLPDGLPRCEWGPTHEIVSCAASLQLMSSGNQEPYRTNIDGVCRLIEWADRHEVTRIHAVSTAYVCGWPSGEIPEAFHEIEPHFQTDYERSKWVAESFLAKWGRANSNVLTVYRPSFLVGDTETGYTMQFNGFYQLARMISLMKEQYCGTEDGELTYVPLRLPGRADDRQNFVPVDFAAGIVAACAVNPELQGRIYHLTDPTPPTNGQIKAWFEEYFCLHGGYFIDQEEVRGERSSAESLLWEQYDLIVPRISRDFEFISRNTAAAAAASGLEVPTLTRERMHALLDYAASARWGQRANRLIA